MKLNIKTNIKVKRQIIKSRLKEIDGNEWRNKDEDKDNERIWTLRLKGRIRLE